MQIEFQLEPGWFRLNRYAVFWSGRNGENASEHRLPGDPWFERIKSGRPRTAPFDASKAWTYSELREIQGTSEEGGCWLGKRQILWEYPTRAAKAADRYWMKHWLRLEQEELLAAARRQVLIEAALQSAQEAAEAT